MGEMVDVKRKRDVIDDIAESDDDLIAEDTDSPVLDGIPDKLIDDTADSLVLDGTVPTDFVNTTIAMDIKREDSYDEEIDIYIDERKTDTSTKTIQRRQSIEDIDRRIEPKKIEKKKKKKKRLKKKTYKF